MSKDKTEQPSKPKIHLLFALDASGSMYGLAEDVRGGFNQYLDDLNPDDADYRVTVRMFNTHVWEHCTNVKPAKVPRLTDLNYRPGGGTALNDAIGNLIAGGLSKEGTRNLVVINTDGEENSSNEWTHAKVKALIAERKDLGDWDFVFLGAGPDKWQQGTTYGMSSAQTRPDRMGTQAMYSGLSVGTRHYAGGASGQSVTATASAASMSGLPVPGSDATMSGASADEDGEDNDGRE